MIAQIFINLDHTNAYNLIHHYEFLVISYGLVNAPSVFKDFVNDILVDNAKEICHSLHGYFRLLTFPRKGEKKQRKQRSGNFISLA